MSDSQKNISLTIDGKAVTVKEGTTILEAAKLLQIEIPHLCYHPSLSIAGNCRVCTVEVEGINNPVISCKEIAKEGMVVKTDSDLAKNARKSALEFLLINHPLDCPICDCSGECLLQDYYFKYSKQPSRFSEDKITKTKRIDAGEKVFLDAERCISCTKCIRFCEEIIGKHEIGIVDRGGTQQIHANKTLNNDYSLCTVDICPVGALTSKDFRFKKRVWFLKEHPSICTGCSTGCNIWIDHEDGVPYRIRPRTNLNVNNEWMCDYGRATYKKLIDENRVLAPFILENDNQKSISWNDAMHSLASKLSDFIGGNIAGIAASEITIEEAASFKCLLKEAIDTEHIFISEIDFDESFADNILKNRNKNANSKGVKLFFLNKLTDNDKFDAYIILGNISESDMKIIRGANPKLVVLISSQFKTNFSEFNLPRLYAEEQQGTMINEKGILQKTSSGYPARGNLKTGWQICEEISQALDKPMSITTSHDAFDLAKKYTDAFNDIVYDTIPLEGIGLL